MESILLYRLIENYYHVKMYKNGDSKKMVKFQNGENGKQKRYFSIDFFNSESVILFILILTTLNETTFPTGIL